VGSDNLCTPAPLLDCGGEHELIIRGGGGGGEGKMLSLTFPVTGFRSDMK
jgi:hypothetical protein